MAKKIKRICKKSDTKNIPKQSKLINEKQRKTKNKGKKKSLCGLAIVAKPNNKDFNNDISFENVNKSNKYSNSKEQSQIKIEYNKIRENSLNINIIKYRNHIIIFKFLLLIDLFIQILPACIFDMMNLNLSKITLNIKGIGYKSIFFHNTTFFAINYYPDEVYINGDKQSEVNFSYNFNQTNNFVELIWNSDINNCKYMFYGCSDITEIDLSNFNSS